MKTCHIESWVDAADDKNTQELRQAIHTIFVAVAKSKYLADNMIVKGGVLLAIRYQSVRFTKDIDFSTSDMFADFDKTKFADELSESLALAVEELPYGLDCKVQSTELQPKNGNLFPTLKVTVGYAYQGTVKHKRLLSGSSTDVVKIDYSFNEMTEEVEVIEISDDNVIKAYSLTDLVAEKYRAIIQQKSRNRTRRQDAYDIYWLISNKYLEQADNFLILKTLIAKASSRGIDIYKEMLNDTDIIERSQADYHMLYQEIEGELPDFELSYKTVREYYESLPWHIFSK